MIAIQKIRQLLLARMPDIAPDSVSEIKRIQENNFHIQHKSKAAFLRWIENSDRKGQNEIEIYQNQLKADEICIPSLLGLIRTDNGILGIWEYLEGPDLRKSDRHRIPEAFQALGEFHIRHRSKSDSESEITISMYADISDMLDHEITTVSGMSSDPLIHDCRDILESLEIGFVTLTHGDLHPGNLVLSHGRVCFVDWGYSRHTLNFSDLGYLWDSDICIDAPEGWWMIIKEARDSLNAYLDATGKGSLSSREIMLAVMVRSQLHSLSNAIHNEFKDATIKCRDRLKCLIRES